jgi:PAS domain S-box-containing protein
VELRATEDTWGSTEPDTSGDERSGSVVKERVSNYQSFFEHSRDCLLILGSDGHILEANPAACTAFQLSVAAICQVALNSLVDVADQRFGLFMQEAQRRGRASAETTFIRKDGTRFTGEIHATIDQDERGKKRSSVIISVLPEHRIATESSLLSESLYSDLFQLSPQPMWVLETETFRFIQVNKAAMQLYGYSREEFISMTLMDIKPKEDISQAKANIKRRSAGYGFSRDTFKHYKKSGETIEVEIYSNPIVIDDKAYLLVIASDVTEKNQHEHSIIKAIIKAQEVERYEISDELHENVCQILAASQLTLGRLKALHDPASVVLLNQSKEYIAHASREIRKLSHRLAPAFHDFTTLKQEFVTLLKSFDPEDKYRIGLHVDDAVTQYNLSLDLKLNLYRILQEQLKNTLQHANCTTIDVKILVEDQKIKMIICDDGVGFEPGGVRNGLGLSNMKRRASLFAGKFQVDSSPGNGCTVVVDIPLSEL